MCCQAFVDECVVRRQQFDRAAVFVQDALKEHLGFGPHRLPQVIVEIRINGSFRSLALQCAQAQPLSGEILH